MRIATFLTLLLAAALITGCDRKTATPASAGGAVAGSAGATTAGGAAAGPADPEDPCRLLEVAEVEALMGPLDGPPYRFERSNSEPQDRGDTCVYVAKDLRNIELSPSWSGGDAMLKMMGNVNDAVGKIGGGAAAPGAARDSSLLHKDTEGGGDSKVPRIKHELPTDFLPHDVAIAGEWDDVRVIGCCAINAFLGDAFVTLDYTASKLTAEQGVGLVNKALLRLKTPIAGIDGRTGVAFAKQRMAERAKHPTACALVSRAEAEAIVGKLSAEPAGSADDCEYHYRTTDNWGGSSEESVRIKVSWSGGFFEYRVHAMTTKTANPLEMAGGANPANVGVKMLSDIGAAMQKGGGDPFSALGKAVKQTAGAAAGKKTATPDAETTATKPNDDDAVPGPWADAAWSYPEFLAVKKDVLVSVEPGFSREIGQKFATRAVEKIR